LNYRIFISDRALSDLRDIRDYIARRSPLNAATFIERLLKEFDVLEALPEAFPKALEEEYVPYTLRQFTVKP